MFFGWNGALYAIAENFETYEHKLIRRNCVNENISLLPHGEISENLMSVNSTFFAFFAARGNFEKSIQQNDAFCSEKILTFCLKCSAGFDRVLHFFWDAVKSITHTFKSGALPTFLNISLQKNGRKPKDWKIYSIRTGNGVWMSSEMSRIWVLFWYRERRY
jgi:hypothetical protein